MARDLLERAYEEYEATQDFTVAVEEEFAILDPETLSLANRFEDLKAAAQGTDLEAHLVGELIASEVEIRTGRWDTRCSLRKGDDLQDVCDSIASGMDCLQAFLRENREILEGLVALQTGGALRAEGEAAGKLRSLMDRAAAATSVYRERFPAPEPSLAENVPVEPELAPQV